MRKLKRIELRRISPLEDVETIELASMPTVETQAIEKPYKGYITQRIQTIYTEYNIIKKTMDALRNK